jgi:hypothetical protein
MALIQIFVEGAVEALGHVVIHLRDQTMRKGTALLIALLMLFVDIWLGWTIRGVGAYDACLDRINYDMALWHLCDQKEPRDQRS